MVAHDHSNEPSGYVIMEYVHQLKNIYLLKEGSTAQNWLVHISLLPPIT
jgi:hypothetical protein